MVTRIVPVQRIDLSNRERQGAMDGARKKVLYGKTFKEILSQELIATAKIAARQSIEP